MARTDVPTHEPYVHGRQMYVRAPKAVHFPSEESAEEHVSETKRHLEARTTLYLLLKDARAGALGSDQFVYWDAEDPRKCLSPDIFVKLGVPDDTFDTWKAWERGAPELAVEIVSASDRRDDDWAEKMARYQASGIAEVVRFDPSGEGPVIRVWDRIEGELLERPATSPTLRECQALRLWWVVVPSAYGPILRLSREPDGAGLLPTADEDRMRLEAALAEERKARTLAEHEKRLAEHEKRLAEQKAREEAQARAAVEAENERLRAENERLRAERR